MARKTLVMGASIKPNRYSYLAVQRLVNKGFEVLAYGLKTGKISDVNIQTELIYDNTIDTVTLYLNPITQKAYYEYLISLKPDRIIFNPGTENLEFYRLLKENNINFEVSCTLTLLATNQY